MFVEELVNHCGLNTYARNMRVARATSSTPAGPYKPVDLPTSYSASTPHAIRDPEDGSWLIFLTGCGVEACLAVDKCSDGITSGGANPYPCPKNNATEEPILQLGHAAPCKCPKPGHKMPGPECSVDRGTNVVRATSPEGPWTLTAPLLDVKHPAKLHADGTPWVFANPSALILKNGSLRKSSRNGHGPRTHTSTWTSAGICICWHTRLARVQLWVATHFPQTVALLGTTREKRPTPPPSRMSMVVLSPTPAGRGQRCF